MSELRTKIAAFVTILAVGALGAFAVTHPSPPPPVAQVQPAAQQPAAHAGASGALSVSDDDPGEGGAADD